ncbi:hypothetical protein ABNX05_11060 [Lysinibacillus sp. M3]|uniref:Uncharacterized protein n=1 Tax=Lysinibacillus zambalensis TaxID=3160866 RepID=A0ABV1MRM3_9BACI
MSNEKSLLDLAKDIQRVKELTQDKSLKEIFTYNTLNASEELNRMTNDIIRYNVSKENIIVSLRQVADHLNSQYSEHIDKFNNN